jgi:hypothetical protein
MTRQLFTIAIFAAVLVGCAASAMHFGAPTAVDASISQSPVKPNTVTGPCYKASGSDCQSTFHFVHDTQLESVQHGTTGSNCPNGQSCTLVPALSFSGNAKFANTNYSCHGLVIYETTGSQVWLPVILNFQAVDDGDAYLGFRNQTGSTIAYGTTIKIAYTCEGA